MKTSSAPPPMTLAALEATQWAQDFKMEAPVSYSAALRYAQQERLRVQVEHSTAAGIAQWAVLVEDDPSFWMDALPTKVAATQLCREMGWKIVA